MAKRLIADYELRINHKQGTYTLSSIRQILLLNHLLIYLGLDMSDVEDEATTLVP